MRCVHAHPGLALRVVFAAPLLLWAGLSACTTPFVEPEDAGPGDHVVAPHDVASDAGWDYGATDQAMDAPSTDGIADAEDPCANPEVCDGVDNDCNGQTDEGVTSPNFCLALGACTGAAPVCAGSAGWCCAYGADVETAPGDPCQVAADESACDEVDGDCDGLTDDHEALKGTACTQGVGICQGSGTYVCDGDAVGLSCNVTMPGDPPTVETCNGLDDDCNDRIDDGAATVMVHVVGGALDFWVGAYEASRPDATSSDPGTVEVASCSRPDVMPWAGVTWTTADAACASAGYRLCTQDEWQEACEGSANAEYPYGAAYDADACNGNDYDPNCGGADDDEAVPTGAAHGCPPPASSLCVSDHGVMDMSGNVEEWTATPSGTDAYRVRGGAYDSIAPGLTCQNDFSVLPEEFQFPNLGFRCCSDIGP